MPDNSRICIRPIRHSPNRSPMSATMVARCARHGEAGRRPAGQVGPGSLPTRFEAAIAVRGPFHPLRAPLGLQRTATTALRRRPPSLCPGRARLSQARLPQDSQPAGKPSMPPSKPLAPTRARARARRRRQRGWRRAVRPAPALKSRPSRCASPRRRHRSTAGPIAPTRHGSSVPLPPGQVPAPAERCDR